MDIPFYDRFFTTRLKEHRIVGVFGFTSKLLRVYKTTARKLVNLRGHCPSNYAVFKERLLITVEKQKLFYYLQTYLYQIRLYKQRSGR